MGRGMGRGMGGGVGYSDGARGPVPLPVVVGFWGAGAGGRLQPRLLRRVAAVEAPLLAQVTGDDGT